MIDNWHFYIITSFPVKMLLWLWMVFSKKRYTNIVFQVFLCHTECTIIVSKFGLICGLSDDMPMINDWTKYQKYPLEVLQYPHHSNYQRLIFGILPVQTVIAYIFFYVVFFQLWRPSCSSTNSINTFILSLRDSWSALTERIWPFPFLTFWQCLSGSASFKYAV